MSKGKPMPKKLFKLVKYSLITLLALFVLLVAGVACRLFYVPPLQPWHTYVPAELTAAELEKATWKEYIDRENAIFDDIYREVSLKMPDSEKTSINRYFAGSAIYPPHFKDNWNRSHLFVPENPQGVAVLLHGLTDSPYSIRHIARLYYQRGFVALVIRLPGHGTVPGGLTKVSWQDWMAATRLAIREARQLGPEGTPLHLVGFSQGGTLAVKYTLDALEDKHLSRPDRLVLISPMIGITPLSSLAELIAIPSFLPGFAKAAWLDVLPEFNPFKFNSFPVNAVRQARLLIAEMGRQIIRLDANGRIKEFPPAIAFQSIADYTVSTPALIDDLYRYLPNNGSELVLFDINRDTAFAPLIRPVFVNMASMLLPDLPQRYKISLIGNAGAGDSSAVERTAMPGATDYTVRQLGVTYPPNVFSLSHVSLPFPENDSLYGSSPDPQKKDEFGVNLGLIANAQGERGILAINTGLFFRISSNPLFPYLEKRLNEVIAASPSPLKNSEKSDNIQAKSPARNMTP